MRYVAMGLAAVLTAAESLIPALAMPIRTPASSESFIWRTQGSPQQLEQRLRKVIGDLRSGHPDLNDMEPTLRIAVQQQLANVTQRLQSLGQIVSIHYVGPQNNAEVFQVQFQQGVSAWMIQTAPNGKLSVLWFN